MIKSMFEFRQPIVFQNFFMLFLLNQELSSSFLTSKSSFYHWMNKLTHFFSSAWSSWCHNRNTVHWFVFVFHSLANFTCTLLSSDNVVRENVSFEKPKHASLTPYHTKSAMDGVSWSRYLHAYINEIKDIYISLILRYATYVWSQYH